MASTLGSPAAIDLEADLARESLAGVLVRDPRRGVMPSGSGRLQLVGRVIRATAARDPGRDQSRRSVMSNFAHRASAPAAAATTSPAGPPQSHANRTGRGFSQRVSGRCRVLHCPRPAELKWMSFPGQPNFLATWAVCGEHFVRLSAGERWASRRGRFPTFGRWLLMGDELESWPRPDF